MNRNYTNRNPFVMRGRYPESFLDDLAKAMGIKWTECVPRTIPAEKINVCPIPPPTGKLYYFEVTYKNNKDGNTY